MYAFGQTHGRGPEEGVIAGGAGTRAHCHLVFPRMGIRQKLWGRLATCGGLATRRNPCKQANRRRLPGYPLGRAQDTILSHN
jgi:hypothetical protein